MRKKRIYVSLPISGRKVEDYTAQCNDACAWLEKHGYEAVSPLKNGLPTEAPIHEHMKADYKLLLSCDAIYLCLDWEYSHGCMNELHVAADCRKVVLTSSMSAMEIFDRLHPNKP